MIIILGVEFRRYIDISGCLKGHANIIVNQTYLLELRDLEKEVVFR